MFCSFAHCMGELYMHGFDAFWANIRMSNRHESQKRNNAYVFNAFWAKLGVSNQHERQKRNIYAWLRYILGTNRAVKSGWGQNCLPFAKFHCVKRIIKNCHHPLIHARRGLCFFKVIIVNWYFVDDF